MSKDRLDGNSHHNPSKDRLDGLWCNNNTKFRLKKIKLYKVGSYSYFSKACRIIIKVINKMWWFWKNHNCYKM